MNCLGLGNVAPDFLTVFLWHSNFQTGHTNAVIVTKSFEGFIGLFHENQLHDSGFEHVFTVEHLEPQPFRYLPRSHVNLKSLMPKTTAHTDAASDPIISGIAAPSCGTTAADTTPTTTVNIENRPRYR